MSKKNPSLDSKKALSDRRYAEPGETPGQKEGLTPTGEKLAEINQAAEEIGGFKGEEPTRYGDWVTNGRCTDF